MTPEEQEEIERCKDPRYFHNKYAVYPGKREYTQKEWDEYMYWFENRSSLKFRNPDYERTINNPGSLHGDAGDQQE